MRVALCPGSYDPVTFGHLNIIQRSAAMYDRVIVLVLVNPDKTCAFTVEERVEMLKMVTAEYPNVAVDFYGGLVVNYAAAHGVTALVKGLRAVTDFEYEFQMALINKKLMPELESVFITTDARFMFLSSSAVREVARFGGDLSHFVPPEIGRIVLSRLGPQKG